MDYRHDNAHNYPLQLAATTGVPAALLFMVMVAWAAVAALKEAQVRGDFLQLGVGAAICAYFVNTLFTVNAFGGAILFWLLWGAALATGGRVVRDKFKVSAQLIAGSFCLLLAVPVLVFPTSAFLADMAYARGVSLAEAGYIEEALPHYERAFRLNPWLDRYRFDLGRFYLIRAIEAGSIADYEAARRHFQDARKLNPLEPNYLIFLARVDIVGWQKVQVGDMARARRLLMTTLDLQPLSPEARYLLAVIDYQERDYRTARTLLKDAVRLYPDYASAYELLGAVEKASGNRAAAEGALRRALELDPALTGAQIKLRELIDYPQAP